MSLWRSLCKKRKDCKIRMCRFLSCDVIWFSASRISCSRLASTTEDRRYSAPITLEPADAAMKDWAGFTVESAR